MQRSGTVAALFPHERPEASPRHHFTAAYLVFLPGVTAQRKGHAQISHRGLPGLSD